MRSLVPKRLAYRLIISLTTVIVLAEGFSGWLSVTTEERLLLNSMITGADQLSRAITSATWHSMLDDHRDAAYQVMQTIALKQGIDRIRIFNKEGRIMFSTIIERSPQVDKRAEECYLCHATDQPLVKIETPNRTRIYRGIDGTRKLAMITPIYNEPSCSEADCHAHPRSISVLGVLDVSLNLAPVDMEIGAVERRVLLNTLIHVLLVGLVIVLFTRHFVDAPIRTLIEATRDVSAMELDKPVPIKTSSELGELAVSFDRMRERLRLAMAELGELTEGLERKVQERTEQLNTAHQKLVQSDRLASLGQLSASVAHEINNPIGGVLNLLMLMQRILRPEGVPSERVEEFRGYLQKAGAETARAGRIVTDLLAFSRRSAPRRADANFNVIIQSTLPIIDHKLKLMNVSVDLHVAEKLEPISCDVSQMQQVIINLIMNAAEAMQAKGGGVVTVRTSMKDDDRFVLEVSDTGGGISQENLARIFDPFFTTKAEGRSVGLGLSVVYGIVKAHKGEIQAKSRPGDGTTFTVMFPLSKKAPSPPPSGTHHEGTPV